MANLCTIEDVLKLQQKSQLEDKEMDALVEDLIPRASVAIMNFTGREFAPETASATRTFEYAGNSILSLAPYDLQSATAVKIDVETSSSTTLTANEDYFLRPKPSKYGVYSYLAGLPLRESGAEVSVAGKWGFAEVPSDVTQACALTVVIWIRNLGATPRGYDADELQPEVRVGLPGAARNLLGHYRKPRVGF